MLSGSGGVLYSWSDGGTTQNNMVAPSLTTIYILNVFNNGCSDEDTVVVDVNKLPDIDASASDYLILEGTSAKLSATGAGVGGMYDWEPPVGLDDPTISNPISSPIQATRYVVKGEDKNGCSDTASVYIDVASSIIFSEGITPNGDGLNDTWMIQLIDEFPGSSVNIYNRWGQKVFESKNYVTQWDGTSNNKKLPVGTYYYLIDLGPNQKKHTGPITIMR
jgi:gliding motility-associated-like protein